MKRIIERIFTKEELGRMLAREIEKLIPEKIQDQIMNVRYAMIIEHGDLKRVEVTAEYESE